MTRQAKPKAPVVRTRYGWERDEFGKPWCAGTVDLGGDEPLSWRAYGECLDPKQRVIVIFGDGTRLEGPTPEADAAVREHALALLARSN